jgi:hypothetical protein
MTSLLTLATTGRSLVPDLEQALAVLDQYGPEWLAEVARVRRVYGPRARLVHPSELPTDEQIQVTLGESNA